MANTKIAKQWLLYSVRDLKQAQKILSMGSEMKYGAAFHAQQCVEKAAKAFLVLRDVRPPRVHDVEKLGKLISENDAKLAILLNKAKRLTRFAVTYRYPDAELKTVSFATIKSHVKMAKTIYDYVAEFFKPK